MKAGASLPFFYWRAADAQQHPRANEKTRRTRVGRVIHPLRSIRPRRPRGAKPRWSAVLDRQGLDGGSQAALVASGLVLVDDFLVSDAVDGRHGLLENAGRGGFVASLDGLFDGLDCGTQGRALSRGVCGLLNCLTTALARLCGISHGIS